MHTSDTFLVGFGLASVVLQVIKVLLTAVASPSYHGNSSFMLSTRMGQASQLERRNACSLYMFIRFSSMNIDSVVFHITVQLLLLVDICSSSRVPPNSGADMLQYCVAQVRIEENSFHVLEGFLSNYMLIRDFSFHSQ